MNDGIVCIGVCINDPETGVCLGCGRQPEAVSAREAGTSCGRPTGTSCGRPTGTSCGRKKNEAMPLSAAQYPLPPQVTHELDNPSD